MTKYEGGRIYSVTRNGVEQFAVAGYGDTCYEWGIAGNAVSDAGVTDVRGPLVVLDLGDVATRYALALMRGSQDKDLTNIADQIEEQTRLQPQVGWHEVSHENGVIAARYWDHEWCHAVGTPDAIQDWTSTHYIGLGSEG